jgi:hypothetical protein
MSMFTQSLSTGFFNLRRVIPVAVSALVIAAQSVDGAEQALSEIKGFLVGKAQFMNAAASDFVRNASAYQAIIDSTGGDYNRAAMERGPDILKLVGKMQDDYRGFHNKGYETIEGIVAGTKTFVDFDVYMDAGVPKAEASTDSPYSPLILRAANGRVISDRNGNLFHYVVEPALWGTKPFLVEKLSATASEKLGVKYLPQADVLTAASIEASRKISDLVARAQAWQPTLDECVGALVWMTPTLNAYFDEWRDSRYDPVASAGRYVAQSRVLDMRGIMSSLQITCNAILPELRTKDPALADQLKFEYESIMSFIARVDARDRTNSGKMSVAAIEEMAFQAKSLTDQIGPHLKQMAAVLGLKLPRKPVLA